MLRVCLTMEDPFSFCAFIGSSSLVENALPPSLFASVSLMMRPCFGKLHDCARAGILQVMVPKTTGFERFN